MKASAWPFKASLTICPRMFKSGAGVGTVGRGVCDGYGLAVGTGSGEIGGLVVGEGCGVGWGTLPAQDGIHVFSALQ